jgi:hypothetical protein
MTLHIILLLPHIILTLLLCKSSGGRSVGIVRSRTQTMKLEFTLQIRNFNNIFMLRSIWDFSAHSRGTNSTLSPDPYNLDPIFNPKLNYTPWPESARELYRPSDRRQLFADRELSRSQRGRSPTAVISIFRPEPLLFLLSSSSIVLTRLSGLRARPTTSLKIW